MSSTGPRPRGGRMPAINTPCGRTARRGPAEGLGPRRVGWSGAGRAAGVTRVAARGVAADRIGPGPTRGGEGGGVEGGGGPGAWRDRPTASDRISGLPPNGLRAGSASVPRSPPLTLPHLKDVGFSVRRHQPGVPGLTLSPRAFGGRRHLVPVMPRGTIWRSGRATCPPGSRRMAWSSPPEDRLVLAIQALSYG